MGCARSSLMQRSWIARDLCMACQAMARGVPCGNEEVDFHRFGAKLKFPISYDFLEFLHVASAWQENPASTRVERTFLIRLSSNRLIVPMSLRLAFSSPLTFATPAVRVLS